MKKLQQKCFLASAGFHSLLIVILVIGPAFLASKSKLDSSPIIDVIPGKLLDGVFSGGGNPNGTPPPPAPVVPRPQPAVQPAPQPEPVKLPEPVKVRAPEPRPEPVKEVKTTLPDPYAFEPTTDRKRKKPEVSTTPVIRKADSKKPVKTADTTSEADQEDQKRAAKNHQLAKIFGQSVETLSKNISPGTSLEAFGPGGGGEVYASYDQAVRSIYWHAWTAPEDSASDAAVTKVTVTIASDGTVLSSRIIKGSGDASVDRSVQRTLDHVTFIRPFPEGAKDKQRTYTINFNLKAKRLSG